MTQSSFSHHQGFGSPRRARNAGLRAALGIPALVLGVSYLGFGALVRESGLGIWHGLLSTAVAWALPGQVLMVELYAMGASLLTIALGVGFSAARLLPMTMTLLPWLQRPGLTQGRRFLAAHWIAVTGWTVTLQVAPRLPPEERLSYFTGFTLTLWLVTLAGTALGFLLPDLLPARVNLALLFLNPIYFLMLFQRDLRIPPRAAALGIGALLGPLFFLLDADWSLPATGLVGGSLAYALTRRKARR